MVHNGSRVGFAQFDASSLQLQCASQPGRVDAFDRQACQLGQVAADEFAFRVKFFALADRVENPEVGLRIAAA